MILGIGVWLLRVIRGSHTTPHLFPRGKDEGETYRFASEDAMTEFKGEPDKYATA